MSLGIRSISTKAGETRLSCAVNRAFNEMAEVTAAANRASNGGNRLATHTTGAAPRPASRSGSRVVGAERRMQSERK
jgi:hypothetical protein